MLRNYLKIALRHLARHPGYAVLNVLGLALGLACCLLILRYVQDERSYDRHHEQADRIFRVAVETESAQRRFQYPSIGSGWRQALEDGIPAIEHGTRLLSPFGQTWMVRDDQRYDEDAFLWVDSTFFDVFTHPFLAGNPAEALRAPQSVVLTRAAALKYFGQTDVVGQRLGIEGGPDGVVDLTVTAVIEDPPPTSHFDFDVLASLSTVRTLNLFGDNTRTVLDENYTFTLAYTYFVLREDASLADVEAQLQPLFMQYTTPADREFVQRLFVQPLTDIHLHSHLLNELAPNSSVSLVYIFIAIAVLTLVIACINFMNLATARSARRAKEVGMRKVVGASQRDLVGQFMGEALVMALLALVVGLVIAWALLPGFNDVVGKELTLLGSPQLLLLMGALALLAGVLAGSYPAFFLASFRPIAVLKGRFSLGGRSVALRKVLVVTQFVCSIFFLIGSIIIYNQLQYVLGAPAGFERAQRVVIPVPIPDADLRTRTIELLKDEIAQHPDVVQVAAASNVPGQLRAITRVRTDAMPADTYQQPATVSVDHDYLQTMGIQVVQGRTFDPALSTDSTEAFLINETTARLLSLSDPVGAPLEWRNGIQDGPNTQAVEGTIIGVFRDLHFEPMTREIAPMVFRVDPQTYFTLVAEVAPGPADGALGHMQQTWNTLVPDRPFQYTYLDDDLAQIYEQEERLSAGVRYLALLAILIACLGLFGLASFTAEQRTKEIGVRKVMGASVGSIIVLLSREFTVLVTIAFAIAVPLGYLLMEAWLTGNFAYHVQIGVWPFVLAGGLSLAVAWLTVSYQSIRAALTNPIDALRYE